MMLTDKIERCRCPVCGYKFIVRVEQYNDEDIEQMIFCKKCRALGVMTNFRVPDIEIEGVGI